MIGAIIGKKAEQSQRFLEERSRIPVTKISVTGNIIVAVKTEEKDGYSALQLGFGEKKRANKSLLGHVKKANLDSVPYSLKEVRILFKDSELPKIGETVTAVQIFKPGDIVDVVGVSKGKGYAGVVKRHHFKGGPRTHGQSDRERAPGSIGQTTTPGRVYKGKRMAGRMGHQRATSKNLVVVDVSEDSLLIKGLVPGASNSIVFVKKTGELKKFVPLHREQVNEKTATTETQNRDETQKLSVSKKFSDSVVTRRVSESEELADKTKQKTDKKGEKDAE